MAKLYKSYWKQNIKNPIYLTSSQNCKLKMLKKYYFSLIYSYINYGNTYLARTYNAKLKKIFTFKKKSATVIFFADRFLFTKLILVDMNVLNVYQININIKT